MSKTAQELKAIAEKHGLKLRKLRGKYVLSLDHFCTTNLDCVEAWLASFEAGMKYAKGLSFEKLMKALSQFPLEPLKVVKPKPGKWIGETDMTEVDKLVDPVVRVRVIPGVPFQGSTEVAGRK